MIPTLKPSDLIVLGSNAWTVKGVLLGAVGQQNIVHLEHTSKTLPNAYGEFVRIFVPLEMLNALVESGSAKVFVPREASEPAPVALTESEWPKWWVLCNDTLCKAEDKNDLGSYCNKDGRVDKSSEGPPMEEHCRIKKRIQLTATEAKAFLNKV